MAGYLWGWFICPVRGGGGASCLLSGVAHALREHHRGRDVVFVGHGLTPDTRRFLLEDIMDVVITQSRMSSSRKTYLELSRLRLGAAKDTAKSAVNYGREILAAFYRSTTPISTELRHLAQLEG